MKSDLHACNISSAGRAFLAVRAGSCPIGSAANVDSWMLCGDSHVENSSADRWRLHPSLFFRSCCTSKTLRCWLVVNYVTYCARGRITWRGEIYSCLSDNVLERSTESHKICRQQPYVVAISSLRIQHKRRVSVGVSVLRTLDNSLCISIIRLQHDRHLSLHNWKQVDNYRHHHHAECKRFVPVL